MDKDVHFHKHHFQALLQEGDFEKLKELDEQVVVRELSEEEKEKFSLSCLALLEHAMKEGKEASCDLVRFTMCFAGDLTDVLGRLDRFLKNAAHQASCEGEKARLFWLWGKCCLAVWKWSEEPIDLRQAFEKFKQAELLGCREGTFWEDYAQLCLIGAREFSDMLLMREGAEYFSKAAERLEGHVEVWLKLAQSYAELYVYSGDKNFITRAEAAFVRAQRLEPTSAKVWIAWGSFLGRVGIYEKKLPLLEAGIEKFRAAEQLEPANLQIIWRYCSILAAIGVQTDELGLIQEAVHRAQLAIKADPKDETEGWVVLGRCLRCLGVYFDEVSYLEDALTQLESAIALEDTSDIAWHELACTHLELGERLGDPLHFERAIYCCEKAVENNPLMPLYYKDLGVSLVHLAEMLGDSASLEKALSQFEKAIHLRGVLTGYADPQWAYHYGLALDFYGDFSDDEGYYRRAVEVLSEVLAIHPMQAQVRYHLALALSHLGEATGEESSLQQACDLLEQMVLEDAEDEEAWCEWGITLLHLAQMGGAGLLCQTGEESPTQEAIDRLLRAARLGSVQALYYLACAYSLEERYEEAIFYIDKAARAKGLPPLVEVMEDEWLEGLRRTEWFQQFLAQIKPDQMRYREES